jgi:carbohydrate-binding DOMON domain-containing protein
MLYIVRFGPYRPHDFIISDASSLLSMTSQNVYNILVTSTTNKALTLYARFRCEISQQIHGKPYYAFSNPKYLF